MIPDEIYSDGGVLLKNPSPYGGMWAYCWVKDGEMTYSKSDKVEAGQFYHPKLISNNYTELYAAVKAIQKLPWEGRHWHGTLFTDSEITLHRLNNTMSFSGIPEWLSIMTLTLRRYKKWKVSLVGGHPTKAELATGFKKKNGLPVSKFNVWCDEACQKIAKDYKISLALK